MHYLKHNEGKQRKKPESKKPQQPQQPNTVVLVGPDSGYPPSPSLQHDINHVAGLDGVEASLDWIAHGLGNLGNDEHTIHLSVGQGSNTNPIQLTLANNDYDATIDLLFTAFERIADSVAKLAGLNRPRLES